MHKQCSFVISVDITKNVLKILFRVGGGGDIHHSVSIPFCISAWQGGYACSHVHISMYTCTVKAVQV